MTICPSTETTMFNGPVSCEREIGHPGDHQNLIKGWVWDSGGGHSIVPNAYDCPVCGTHDVASDLRTTRMEGDQCASCDFWDERTSAYQDGTAFAAEGRMYTLNPDYPNGFGGAKVIIHHADGRTDGPVAGLWHNGTIPHERRSALPDNARIEWVN